MHCFISSEFGAISRRRKRSASGMRRLHLRSWICTIVSLRYAFYSSSVTLPFITTGWTSQPVTSLCCLQIFLTLFLPWFERCRVKITIDNRVHRSFLRRAFDVIDTGTCLSDMSPMTCPDVITWRRNRFFCVTRRRSSDVAAAVRRWQPFARNRLLDESWKIWKTLAIFGLSSVVIPQNYASRIPSTARHHFADSRLSVPHQICCGSSDHIVVHFCFFGSFIRFVQLISGRRLGQ